jgi:hypothetical protein
MAGELIIKNGLIISGSTNISGSIIATSFTGSFSGTITDAVSASFAVSSSRAVSSSFSISSSQAISSSYALSSSQAMSSSFAVSSSRAISSSFSISSSFALSASYAPGGDAFPFTGSAQISGSLIVTGATLVQDGSLGVVSTGTTNATDALKVQNATPEDLLVVKDDGELRINTTKYANNGVLTNNAGIITEVVGYNGPPVVIQQPAPAPPLTFNIQNGIIISVT